jgi:sterol desaturase/sphingolipid hydroxylase (fatty acid hydroxylase superfamily)
MEPALWLADLAERVSAATAELLRYPFNPDQRIHLAYLASALVLALAVLWWRQRRAGLGLVAALRELFAPRVWWHASARLDYMLFLLNPLVRAVLLAGGLSMVPVALAVSGALDRGGIDGPGPLPDGTVTALFTVALFVMDDFTRYGLHRALHRVPALWALHRVHHSAEVLTPITVYRLHPLESALYSLRMVLAQGMVVGVFFHFFGMRLSAWEVAGANLFTYGFNLAGSNLRHSHVWLSWGPWLERLVISPAQHQIHHSDNPAHHDRNFGSFLAVWDALFGSLVLARGQTVTGFGLGYRPFRGPVAAWWRPVRDAFKALRPGYSRG